MRKMMLLASAGAGTLALLAPMAALAQEAGKVEEVVVTASRVERQGYVAPSPTTVLGQKDVELRAPSSVVALVNEVPSFRPSNTSISRPAFQGSASVAVDLRGLGNRRTLTLVDKQRFTPAAANGVADLNLLPTNMVDRVEVVTGGASAAYGSDAVSGVVNFITKKKISGINGEISGGVAQAGDDGKFHAALSTGGSFLNDKLHVAVGAEYYQEGIVNDIYARSWGRKETATVIYPGTVASRPAGQPARLVVDHVRTTNQSTFGGVIINSAVGGASNIGGIATNGTAINQALFGATNTAVQFGTGGTILPYNLGQAFGTSSIGGGNYGETGGRLLSLSPEQHRGSMLANFMYEVTPDITANLQVNYAKSDTYFNTASRRDFNTVSASANPAVTPTDFMFIRADNAFLPTAVSSVMAQRGIGAFYMGRVGFDLGMAHADQYNEMKRVTLSVDGKLNWKGNWKWNLAADVGQVFYNQNWKNETVESRWQKSYDAVKNAAGQIVCRVNQVTVTDAACVPFNAFGYNSAANIEAVRGYVEGVLVQQDTYNQQALEANISGEPFSTWAGPVSVAAGLGYRNDSIKQTSDPISQATDFDNQNPKAFSGSYNTKEFYAETVLPLAKDMPFIKQWDLNGAVRRTEYSTSGGVTTWKVGSTLQVNDEVRFRGTLSQDIRAPNLIELFGSQQAVGSVNNPYTNINSGTIQNFTVGNPSLKPEVAKTSTAGIVLEPKFLPRFRTSIDFWHVNIDGAIASYTAQKITDSCRIEADSGKPGFFCGQLINNGQYNNSLVIFGLRTLPFNLVKQTAEGIDFEAYYSHPVPFDGNLNFRFFATYLHDLTLYDVTSSTQYAGTVAFVFNGLGGAPHWQWTLNTDYSRGPATISLQTRFVGAANIDPALIGPDNPNYSPTLANSVNVNRIGNQWYFNLSGTYNIRDNGKTRLQAFAVVNNLFDHNPPWELGTGAGTNGQFYDTLGRTYQAGIRFKF
jgi:outer membrane receptor protein involved in Fe transport